MDPGSSGEMGLSSAYLSQVSIREAVQVLLETTDVNCVLVSVGIEVRTVRPAQSMAAWAASEGTTVIASTRGDLAATTLRAPRQVALSQRLSP